MCKVYFFKAQMNRCFLARPPPTPVWVNRKRRCNYLQEKFEGEENGKKKEFLFLTTSPPLQDNVAYASDSPRRGERETYLKKGSDEWNIFIEI